MGDRATGSDEAELVDELRQALGSPRRVAAWTEETDGVPGPSLSAEVADHHGATPSARPVSDAALRIADRILGGGAATAASQDASKAAPSGQGDVGMGLVVGARRVAVPVRGVVLGRDPGPAGVVVADSHVSRRHIRVTRTDTGLAVADLESTNGTTVARGDDWLPVGAAAESIEPGDRILTLNGVLLAEVVSVRSEGGLS